jgi:hypothetical protein
MDAMQHLATYELIGAFLMIGVSQAAPESTAPANPAATNAPVATGAVPSDRQTFTRKAEADMKMWDIRLHAIGSGALSKGSAVGAKADSELQAAWTGAQGATRRLETATSEGWQDTKAFYERKTQDLLEAWHKFHPTSSP